jgi:hypothetical protein
MAVDLADGGVHIDGHWLLARAGAGGPCSGKERLGDAVELADVTEGERAQERAERGWGDDPVAEHLSGLPGAEHIGVVDAVATNH